MFRCIFTYETMTLALYVKVVRWIRWWPGTSAKRQMNKCRLANKQKKNRHIHTTNQPRILFAHKRKKNEIEIVKENEETRRKIKRKKATHLHIYENGQKVVQITNVSSF